MLALKEDGNMRATRWMAHMTPEEEDNDVLRRHSLFRDGVIKRLLLSNHVPTFLTRSINVYVVLFSLWLLHVCESFFFKSILLLLM